MNVLRLNTPWSVKLDSHIDEIKKMNGVCDEGWLGLWGYYTEEELDKLEANYAHAVERLRDANIRYVFEIGANLGHSDSENETAPTASFRNMVDLFGKTYHGVYCPRCENLRAYQHRLINRFVKYQPYAVIIDDDTRLEYHGKINLGCFCDKCIELFNERNGYNLSRNEISRKFLTDSDFRKQYMEFDRESLASYFEYMASEVKAISPDSRMGFENVYLSQHHGGNHTHVWEALHRVSGHDVIARSGCFVYLDERPRDVLSKLLTIHYQNTQLPDYVSTRRPEIENLDSTCMGKSVRGTMMEAEINLAFGCNGTSFHMIFEYGDPVSYDMRYLKALEKERPYFETLVKWNKQSRVSGLHPVLYEDAYCTLTLTEEEAKEAENGKRNINFWGNVPFTAGRDIWTLGIPLSYEDDSAYLLHANMIPYLTDKQIEELLSKNVLTDGEAVCALTARGFGSKLPICAEACDYPSQDFYLPHSITEGLTPGYMYSLVAPRPCHEIIPKENAEANGYFTPLAKYDSKISSALIKTGNGGTWGICANRLFRLEINSQRRLFLLNLTDALAGGFAARLLSPEQAVIIPRKNKDGKCTGIFAHSITISDSEELTFEVLNPAKEKFIWMTPDGKTLECAYEKKNGRYLVHTPYLPAYQSGLLLCDDIE